MSVWQAVAKSDEQQRPTIDLHGMRVSGDAVGMTSGRQQRTVRMAFMQPVLTHLLSGWRWLEQRRNAQLAIPRLQVAETISLGEKRFVSILQVDGAQFLIGGSAASVQLLAVLDKRRAGFAPLFEAEKEP